MIMQQIQLEFHPHSTVEREDNARRTDRTAFH